jgi:hypothetical protein
MCSSFTFPGGDTLFFRFKIDPQTATLTPIGTPLIFHTENSFAQFSSQPVTATNDVYFLLNSYPQAWNNYSVGHLNLVDFTFESWPVMHSSKSPFFLNAHVGIFNNVAQVDQLLFSVGCGPYDASESVPETMCTPDRQNSKKNGEIRVEILTKIKSGKAHIFRILFPLACLLRLMRRKSTRFYQ